MEKKVLLKITMECRNFLKIKRILKNIKKIYNDATVRITGCQSIIEINIYSMSRKIIFLDLLGKNNLSSITKIIIEGFTNPKYEFQVCFKNMKNLKEIIVKDVILIPATSDVFINCFSLKKIPQLDTSNMISMVLMFANCYSLTSIPQLDTSKVKAMTDMFSECYSLTSIPQLDTSKVEDMCGMFSGCKSLIIIPQLNTNNVKNMNCMFYECKSLISIPRLDMNNVEKNYCMYKGTQFEKIME